jgi:hypothetical protein
MVSPIKTRGHNYSRYDGMLLEKPREKAVATNGVKCGRARGSCPRRSVRESIVGAGIHSVYTNRKLEEYDLLNDEWRWWCKYQERQRVSSRVRRF